MMHLWKAAGLVVVNASVKGSFSVSYPDHQTCSTELGCIQLLLSLLTCDASGTGWSIGPEHAGRGVQSYVAVKCCCYCWLC